MADKIEYFKCTDCGNECRLEFHNNYMYGMQKPNNCIYAQGHIVNWKKVD